MNTGTPSKLASKADDIDEPMDAAPGFFFPSTGLFIEASDLGDAQKLHGEQVKKMNTRKDGDG